MKPQATKKCSLLFHEHLISVSLPARATASIRSKFLTTFPSKNEPVRREEVHIRQGGSDEGSQITLSITYPGTRIAQLAGPWHPRLGVRFRAAYLHKQYDFDASFTEPRWCNDLHL